MLSQRCRHQYEETIPRLMKDTITLTSTKDVINLSVSDNQLAKEFYFDSKLGELPAKRYSYTSGIGGDADVQEATARLMNTYFHPVKPVLSSHVVLAAGGSYALAALVSQICDPGEGVMIATPYWPGLDIAISIRSTAKVVAVAMPVDEYLDSCVLRYEDALISAAKNGVAVKAVLVTNPSNPMGRCYKKSTLERILDFTRRHGLHYISDEVYGLSVYQSEDSFISALALGGPNENVHVIYSLSKDFGCNGLRVGMLVTQNNDAVRLGTALATDSQVSSVACFFALSNILNEASLTALVERNVKALHKASYRTLAFLRARNITKFVRPTAGLYVYARLCQTSKPSEEERLRQFLRAKGVALASGREYHCSEAGWFRLCFAVADHDLLTGLNRIGLALDEFVVDSS